MNFEMARKGHPYFHNKYDIILTNLKQDRATCGILASMKRQGNLEEKQIVICINLAHGGWRDFLSGFLEASRTKRGWRLRIVDPADFTAQRIEEFSRKGIDGIVAGNISEQATHQLICSKTPLVLVGSQSSAISKRTANIVFVHHDDLSIGEDAHGVLQKLGNFNSWAFLSAEGNPRWSELRLQGFSRVHPGGRNALTVFKCPFQRGSDEYEKRLGRWIEALPKPAAVMASCDSYAVDFVEASRTIDVNIPKQVTLIGVDNDVLLCETTTPTLSSIAPDHVEEGRLAANALSALLTRRHTKPKTILCSKKTTVFRESTSSVTPATTIIRRALEFVKSHACEDIRVEDVVSRLGVSRSLLELRFRQFHEKSLAKVILETRLQEVRRRLLRSSSSFVDISRTCGWRNTNALKNAFRRHYGMSMREMRKQR